MAVTGAGSGSLVNYVPGKFPADQANIPVQKYIFGELGKASTSLNLLNSAFAVSTTAFRVFQLPIARLSFGVRTMVIDSTVAAATNFGAIVAGGGTNVVPVYSDGTNWRIG